MRLNILIGGKAGQGINKVSGIVSGVLSKLGYFTFNYRDYPSLIRGGHNFNVLSISDEQIESHESSLDVIVAMDERTLETHKSFQKTDCEIIKADEFKDAGKNLNIVLAGILIKLLGISFKSLSEELVLQFKESKDKAAFAKKGFDSRKKKFDLKPLKKKISILSGSEAVAVGARNSGLDIYFAYPMTPATNALHELAKDQVKNNLMVFQAENEIAAASMAGGILSKRLHNHRSSKEIMTYGIFSIAIATTIFSLVAIINHSFYHIPNHIMISLTLISQMVCSLGICMATSNALALSLVNYKNVIGTASSLFGFFYYCLISLFTFFMGLLHNGSLLPMPLYFFALSWLMVLINQSLLKGNE